MRANKPHPLNMVEGEGWLDRPFQRLRRARQGAVDPLEIAKFLWLSRGVIHEIAGVRFRPAGDIA